jgi:hypothetical protein
VSRREEGGLRTYEEGGLHAGIELAFSQPGVAMGEQRVDGGLESAASGSKGMHAAGLDRRSIDHNSVVLLLLLLVGGQGRGCCCCRARSVGGRLDSEERRRHCLPSVRLAGCLSRARWLTCEHCERASVVRCGVLSPAMCVPLP